MSNIGCAVINDTSEIVQRYHVCIMLSQIGNFGFWGESNHQK